MLRLFVEEAAALASISLFIGMIAVWAQVIPQLWNRPRSGLFPAWKCRLGKSRMAGGRAAFRVDSAGPRHHHRCTRVGICGGGKPPWMA
jgi:hypothetical protein